MFVVHWGYDRGASGFRSPLRFLLRGQSTYLWRPRSRHHTPRKKGHLCFEVAFALLFFVIVARGSAMLFCLGGLFDLQSICTLLKVIRVFFTTEDRIGSSCTSDQAQGRMLCGRRCNTDWNRWMEPIAGAAPLV
jgi:hypothetical protein